MRHTTRAVIVQDNQSITITGEHHVTRHAHPYTKRPVSVYTAAAGTHATVTTHNATGNTVREFVLGEEQCPCGGGETCNRS